MRFARHKLIEIIQKRVEQQEQEAVENLAIRQRNWDTKNARWWQDEAPLWNDLADDIVNRIDRNQPITDDSIFNRVRKIRGFSAEYRYYNLSDRPEQVELKRETKRLKDLLAVLFAAEDDFVTETSLNKMGFKLNEIITEVE